MSLANFKKLIAVLCFYLAVPLSLSAIECPMTLLWANGELWAYRAVDCTSPRNCNVATNYVLIYDHVVSATGCKSSATECVCRLSDADNDYLFRVYIKRDEAADVYVMRPNLPINNNGCSFIDAFNVPINGTEDYFQCIEFRYKPDPTQPDRNMRIAIRLESKPNIYLVNDDATLNDANDPEALIRKVNNSEIRYQILRSRKLLLEEKSGSASDTSAPEQTPPVPAPDQTPPSPTTEKIPQVPAAKQSPPTKAPEPSGGGGADSPDRG